MPRSTTAIEDEVLINEQADQERLVAILDRKIEAQQEPLNGWREQGVADAQRALELAA